MSDKPVDEQIGGNEDNQVVTEPQLQSEQLESDIAALQEELAAAQAKAQDNWDQLLRAKAEMENIRRRAATDVEKAHKYSSERFARELLDVVDSLEKGLESTTGKTEEIQAIHDGINLTYKLLIDTLEKHEIKMLDPQQGETFDPSKHEALAMQESADFEPNSILTVVQRGFTIHERVLRPARVIVARASQQPGSPTVDEKA
jgi:molecular chaperone GrpE